MKRCTKCGAEMNDDDVFCSECGAKNTLVTDNSSKTIKAKLGKKPVFTTPVIPDLRKPKTVENKKSIKKLESIDKTIIRNYFFGSGSLLSTLLIIAGIPLLFVMGIGLILIGIGIYMKMRSNSEGEAEVDRAERYFIEQLKNNYLDKINVDESEVNLIDPIVVVGFGEEPDRSLSLNESDLSSNSSNLFSHLFRSVMSTPASSDPIKAYKVGTDGYVRSLLLQVTTYVFSEEQMFVYTGNIDISTGMIYDEYTNEIFYDDISDIFMEESMAKVFNKKEKNFTYYKKQYIGLRGNGFNLGSSMRANLSSDAFNEQFAAMRNLIRDKKRS